MKKILIILTLLLCTSLIYSMESKLFDSLLLDIQNGNIEKIDTFLSKHEDQYQTDPEYFVLLLNHTVLKGESRQIVLEQGAPENGDLEIVSIETGEAVGLMGERLSYDQTLFTKNIQLTRNALQYFPERLDIHFGVILAAEKIEDWQVVGEHTVDILKISKRINNKWTWGTVNSLEGNPQEFLINNILNKTSALFYVNNPQADSALKNISNALIEYYPELVYGYANLGGYYLAHKEYDRAEQYFSQALKIDPDDPIVLGNLEYLEQLKSKQ